MSTEDVLAFLHEAGMTDLTTKAISHMCDRGKLKFTKIGRRRRFSRSYMEAWIDEHIKNAER